MNDEDCGSGAGTPATDERLDVADEIRFSDSATLEVAPRRLQIRRRARSLLVGNLQGRFGQAIRGAERAVREAAACECLCKSLERFHSHRFGAVESHGPAAQIQVLLLIGTDAVDAKLVGEIGSAAMGRAIT